MLTFVIDGGEPVRRAAAKQPIAFEVPETIIDLFETIEVAHEHPTKQIPGRMVGHSESDNVVQKGVVPFADASASAWSI